MAYHSSVVNEPKVSSIETRALNPFRVIPGVPTRIMDLSGVLVRVHIDILLEKIKFRSTSKNDKKEVREILMKNYIALFKDLMKNFFSTDAYMYGVLQGENFFIYDIFTNSNWFLFDDLNDIVEKYNYKVDGMAILQPVKAGELSYIEVVEFIADTIKKDPTKNGRLHILPYYDIVSGTNYVPKRQYETYNSLGVAGEEEELYSKPYTPAKTAYTSYDYSNEDDAYYDDYGALWQKAREDKKKVPILIGTTKGAKADKKKVDCSTSDIIEYNPCQLMDKKERAEAYKTSYYNILTHYKNKFKAEPSKETDIIIKTIAYLWGVWSNFKLRGEIIKFIKEKENFAPFLKMIAADKLNCYSSLFLSLWMKYHRNNIERMYRDYKIKISTSFLTKILEGEFNFFDTSFQISVSQMMATI